MTPIYGHLKSKSLNQRSNFEKKIIVTNGVSFLRGGQRARAEMTIATRSMRATPQRARIHFIAKHVIFQAKNCMFCQRAHSAEWTIALRKRDVMT